MNELINIIRNSLRSNSFYIPSQKTFVNGCSLTIKQYNDLLELDATVDFGFEQYIKYSILTDNIVKENVDSIDNILYFDKPFLLAQIKMAQENEFLGVSLQKYQDNLKSKSESFSLDSYKAEFNSNNLLVTFGLNKFVDVQQINKNYIEAINNVYNKTGDVVTLEIFKFLKDVSYLNQSLGDTKNVKELKPLVDQLPASLVENFNELLQTVNGDIKTYNTVDIDGENFVFNPTLEFMLL